MPFSNGDDNIIIIFTLFEQLVSMLFYEHQQRHNIVVTHGAIGANALVHETLVEPGDHVISVRPTYQQHYSIPESYGATVDILHLRPENGFLPDLEDFAAQTMGLFIDDEDVGIEGRRGMKNNGCAQRHCLFDVHRQFQRRHPHRVHGG